LRNGAAALHNPPAADDLERHGPDRAGARPQQRGGRRHFTGGDAEREAGRIGSRGGDEDEQRPDG
jgi:hypothetical protein